MSTYIRVIRPNARPPAQKAPHIQHLDTYTGIVGARNFLLPLQKDLVSAIALLEQVILRDPKNLRNHAQRLILITRRQDRLGITGALVDLWLTLGAGGVALKQYFLAHANSLIDLDFQAILQAHMSADIQPAIAHHPVTGSILWQAHMPRPALIRPREAITRRCDEQSTTPPPENRDPAILEANEFIANGQLDLALETLENVVLSTPENDDAVVFLQKLYQKAGERTREEIMAEQLKINFGHLPKAWMS